MSDSAQFTHEEWENAEKVDFEISAEAHDELVAAMDALKAVCTKHDVPLHVQMSVSKTEGAFGLTGTSMFRNPARIPREMLVSHLLATGKAEAAFQVLFS